MRDYRVLVITTQLVEKMNQTLTELRTDKLEHCVYPLGELLVYFCSVTVLAWSWGYCVSITVLECEITVSVLLC